MAGIFAGLTRLLSGRDVPVQVAAVCYRFRESSVEFLLVKTSSGKWTFPKGNLNPSVSPSQSAALEAFEEAGVKGVIAERHFGSYLDAKRTLGDDERSRQIRVVAYLLEVHSTVLPEESGRKPTWFTAQDAKLRLADGRAVVYGKQIAKIVDSALESLASSHKRRLRIVSRDQRRRLATAR
jgi:8-oxo-dGTP pyrophosphatase MutT (NUDIX family)